MLVHSWREDTVSSEYTMCVTMHLKMLIQLVSSLNELLIKHKPEDWF